MQQYAKKEEFKNELLDIKKKNVKIERKILDLEIQIEGLMDMLNEGEENSGKQRQKINITNPKIRKKMLEEQRKRQREML